MIKSLSPYYVSIPFVSTASGLTCTDYTLSIWIWNGDKASVPTTPEYTFTKTNPTESTGSDKVNISRLISDFIEFAPQSNNASGVINGNNQQWVKTSVTYTTTDPNDATTPQEESTQLFSLGYSYGYEGENITTIQNNILITPQDYKVNRQGVFIVPVLADEVSAENYSIISYPDNEINISSSIAATTNSSELVQYLWVQCNETTNDKYIEVVYNGQTTTLLLEDECKYVHYDVIFQNKEGAEQVITFFKERSANMNVSSETFESDRGQPSDGNHQFVRLNVQGRSSVKLNTGWVDEDMNDVFTQLFLSERIWIYIDDIFTPLNVKSKNLQYKTRQKERLISYEVDFDLSYNEINSI